MLTRELGLEVGLEVGREVGLEVGLEVEGVEKPVGSFAISEDPLTGLFVLEGECASGSRYELLSAGETPRMNGVDRAMVLDLALALEGVGEAPLKALGDAYSVSEAPP